MQLVEISKTFPGQKALDEVNLSLHGGVVHGLVGHNGSGKSTLVKILAGFHAPDPGGQVLLWPETDPAATGGDGTSLAFVHQDLALCEELSILENFYQGRYWRTPQGRVDWPRHRNDAREWFHRLGLSFELDAPVSSLSSPERAMLAVARAARQILDSDQKGLLVLDEPTPYLSADGAHRLFQVVKRAAAAGAAVLFVGHDLEEVLEHTDEVFVMRGGRLVARHTTADVSAEQLVVELIGKELAGPGGSARRFTGTGVRMELSGVRCAGVESFDLTLHAGEIVGMTGPLGSGFDRIPYAAFGAEPATGTVVLDGVPRPLARVNPVWATERGMALIPGNRQTQAGMIDRPAHENITMLCIDRHRTPAGRIQQRRLVASACELMERHNVAPRREDLPFGLFSGGNQQKLVVGKWLSMSPTVILMHEPTAGVDVGAKRELLDGLVAAAAGGAGVLVASTDMDDLLEVCDRILVMNEGRVVQEFDRASVNKHTLVAACMGGSQSR